MKIGKNQKLEEPYVPYVKNLKSGVNVPEKFKSYQILAYGNKILPESGAFGTPESGVYGPQNLGSQRLQKLESIDL